MPAAGAIVGAVGSIAGGAMGSRAQGQATQAQTQGQREAIQAQLAMFNQARADQMPLMLAGRAAIPLYMQLLGLNPIQFGSPSAGGVQMNVSGGARGRSWGDHFRDQLGIPGVGRISSNPIKAFGDTLATPFRNFADWSGEAMQDDLGNATFTYGDGGNTYDQDGNLIGGQTGAQAATQTQAQPLDLNALIAATPGYQFRLQEGQRAAERSAAARGSLASGSTLRALTRYGEGLAANEYGDFANRLASLIGIGQTAATTTGGWGQQTGANIGQNLANIGAARGSGYANQGNIWGNAIGGAAQSLGSYFGNRQYGGTSASPGPSPYNQNVWAGYGYN